MRVPHLRWRLDRESAFLEATPGGSNVFFLTDAQLLPQDTDTAFDIYDARECTALAPCLTPPTAEAAPCTETEACRPAQQATQIGEPAGTIDASGPQRCLSCRASQTSRPGQESSKAADTRSTAEAGAAELSKALCALT